MPQPKITLREITQDNLLEIMRLEVADNQKCFVATNDRSMAQAHFCDKAWYRGIYADDTPVGFAMLYVDREKPEYDLWRFMIDKNHQKKDYGRKAMELIIQHVKTLPKVDKLWLSYGPGEGNPSGFYSKLGFVETGDESGGEIVMVLKL